MLTFSLCTYSLAFSRLSASHMQIYRVIWIVPYFLEFFTLDSLNNSLCFSTQENCCVLLVILFPASKSGLLLQAVKTFILRITPLGLLLLNFWKALLLNISSCFLVAYHGKVNLVLPLCPEAEFPVLHFNFILEMAD